MQQIGPKLQAHVPPEHAAFIRGEAKRRGLREPDVHRELLAIGIAALEASRHGRRWPVIVIDGVERA